MDIEQSPKLTQVTDRAKTLRTIILLGLIGILACIVAAYIYFGMQHAKQSAVPPVSEEGAPTNVVDREAILSALENATPTVSPEEQALIVEGLETAPQATPAERAAILEALAQ